MCNSRFFLPTLKAKVSDAPGWLSCLKSGLLGHRSPTSQLGTTRPNQARLYWLAPFASAFMVFSAHATAAEPENSSPANGSDSTPSDVVPPRAIETKIVPPVDVTELVEVELELVIDARGQVTSAMVNSGPEPFRSAAEAAAMHFTFTPALRKGVAVSAKVRFLVRFEPTIHEEPEPVLEQPQPKATGARAAAKKPAQPELEVTVTGTRTTQVSTRITRVEAREIPGTFGDPLRAVETNPGVVPLYTGVPFFFIRGAPPGDVGYYVDGIRIPLLYHALIGPSVIHPGLIDHVDVFRGAAPMRYGGSAGATVAAESREPLSSAGGEGNLRVFDVGGLVEQPFDNGRLHVLVGGRYSYTALIASLLSGATLEYWDYQTRVSYDLDRRNRLTITAFGAFDKFEANGTSSLLNQQNSANNTSPGSTAPSESGNLYGGGLQFHRVDLREDYVGARTRARLAVTAGYDRTSTSTGFLDNPVLTTRSFLEYRVCPELQLEVGHNTSVADYQLQVPTTVAGFDVLRGLFPTRRDMTAGGYLEATWSPMPFLNLVPGVRADAYRSGTDTATSTDARFSAVVIGSRHFRAIETVGTSHQPPGFVPQIPGAQVGSLAGGLQRSLQISSGFAFDIADEFTGVVTAFEAQYDNLVDPISEYRTFDLTMLDPNEILNIRTHGTAKGLEFELHRPLTHRLGGFIAYTLSRNERVIDGYSSLSGFDRPHVFQGALGYDMGRNWRAGARLMAYSGLAAKQQLRDGSNIYIYDGKVRAPPFVRVDLRLEKRWRFGTRSYWAIVAEMLNATMSKEVTSLNCSVTKCIQQSSGPVAIPSIGIEIYSY